MTCNWQVECVAVSSKLYVGEVDLFDRDGGFEIETPEVLYVVIVCVCVCVVVVVVGVLCVYV